MKNLVPRVLRPLLAVLLVLTFVNTAFAQHAAKGDNGVSGQQAAKDNATGKLRQPSAEEAKDLIDGLTPLVNQSAEGLTVVQHENSALSVDLQGRFMSAVVAKVGADGKIQQRCVTSIAEAKRLFVVDGATAKSPVSKPAPALEEK